MAILMALKVGLSHKVEIFRFHLSMLWRIFASLLGLFVPYVFYVGHFWVLSYLQFTKELTAEFSAKSL